MRNSVYGLSNFIESPLAFIRQHDFQLSWRHAIGVSLLISMAYQVHQPFSSLSLWLSRVSLSCLGWVVALAIFSACIDFWAQYLGYRSKLKPLYASLGLIAWPLILYLPLQLIHPMAWEWVAPLAYLYIGIQAYYVVQHHYRLSRLKTIWLLMLPGISGFIVFSLSLVLLIQSIK